MNSIVLCGYTGTVNVWYLKPIMLLRVNGGTGEADTLMTVNIFIFDIQSQ